MTAHCLLISFSLLMFWVASLYSAPSDMTKLVAFIPWKPVAEGLTFDIYHLRVSSH